MNVNHQSKPKNKLYCKGYFCSRLTDNGFSITKLNIPYEKDDLRKWSIVVNSKNTEYKYNILITCFKDNITKEFCFKFQGQKKKEFILKTMSMEIIIKILKKTMTKNVEDDYVK